MPIESSTDVSKSLTIYTGKGELTYEEVKGAIEAFYESCRTECVLWDLQAASTERISPSQVKQIASLLKQYSEYRRGVRTAIVSSQDMTFGLARMLVTMLEVKEQNTSLFMHVFRTIEEAYHWLLDGK
jgi:hypothetical protein